MNKGLQKVKLFKMEFDLKKLTKAPGLYIQSSGLYFPYSGLHSPSSGLNIPCG